MIAPRRRNRERPDARKQLVVDPETGRAENYPTADGRVYVVNAQDPRIVRLGT